MIISNGDSIVKNNVLNIEIGQKLRAARIDLGMTQVHAARLVGLHPVTLSNMERGSRYILAIELPILAAVYKLDINRLLASQFAGVAK